MLDWLGNALGGAVLEIPVGVPPIWVEKLGKLLNPLDELAGCRAGLARDIADHVLNGGSLSVLHEISQLPAVAKHLNLSNFLGIYHTRKVTPSIYDEFTNLPVEVALRWAKVLEASLAHTANVQYTFILPNNCRWPALLIVHAVLCSELDLRTSRPAVKILDWGFLEAMLAEDGLPASSVLVSAFSTPVDSGYGVERHLFLVSDIEGYADALERQIEEIRPYLPVGKAPQKLHMINLLEQANPQTLGLLAPQLGALATSASKQLRAAAASLIAKSPIAVITSLKEIAEREKPEQRLYALRLLWQRAMQTNDAELLAYTRATAAGDKAASVQALIQDWDREHRASANPNDYDYELPSVDWSNTLTPEVKNAVASLWTETNAAIDANNKKSLAWHEAMLAKGYQPQLRRLEPLTNDEQRQLLDYIASPEPRPGEPAASKKSGRYASYQPIQRFVTNPCVTPAMLLKTLIFSACIQ